MSRRVDAAQLQLVYRAVVVAKLTYASRSWCGFTTASDRQRLEGFLRRGCRQNLYSTDKPTITQIVEEADENLFNSIRYNPSHLLHQVFLDKLNPPIACDLDPTTLNSLISTTTEILLTACFLPARRYASAGNSDRNVSVCLSVRLSVSLSRAGIVSKRRFHDFFTIW